jgi:DNA-cytosine methyltransferase
MAVKKIGIQVIDLFCGGGGFSEGFRQAGFDVIFGIDNWKPACETHTINGPGEAKDIDILEIEVDDVLAIKKYLEKRYGEVDVIIGSPPCTEFSYAKKGGKGDIEKGMVLVRKNLLFVALFKPKYWLIENVPRLEYALNKECKGSRQIGWTISYEKLGIPKNRFKELGLKGDVLNIPYGKVFTATDFGASQNRKRFIAGDFPIELIDELKVDVNTDVSLGGLLMRLERHVEKSENGFVEDPNYPTHRVKRDIIRDYGYDTSLHPMYCEEIRHLKRRHIQYGRMHFPENTDAPARTIMATSTSSSRESLIFETDKKMVYQGRKRKVFRQPSVREVACIQGFPLDFQLAANRINDRYKLVGNAVPCQLAYALARTISSDIERSLSVAHNGDFMKRANVTLSRQVENVHRPLIYEPKKVVDEAEDIKQVHKEFKAKFPKKIRRKLLSSKLEKHSSIVIFENQDVVNGKLTGGLSWKICLQVGIGKQYRKVYLDEASVSTILKSLDATIMPSKEYKALLKHLLKEADRGMPALRDEWIEFPGYKDSPERYLSFIMNRRLKIPGVEMFQKAFTSDMKEIGKIVGPIDFFDSLDAIMLLSLCHKRFRKLWKKMVYISSLMDTGNYPDRLDTRIIPRLNNIKLPLVTLMAALVSAHILHKMYKRDGEITGGYPASLKKSDAKIIRWCS